jgi:hypothetical protein
VILAILACASPDPAGGDTAAPEPGVVAGSFAVDVAEEWDGDCAFDDLATYQEPQQVWTFEPRNHGVLILSTGTWDLLSCSFEGQDFVCDEGSYADGRTRVTREIAGAFPSDTTVEGAFVVELDCSGSGCDDLQDAYGSGIEFPCRAEAPFTGRREE